MSVAMRLFLQLNVILINWFVFKWTQTVRAEVMMEKHMTERNASVSYSSDPSLTLINVVGLSRLEFGLRGCSGARIVLLMEPNNFTDFVEIILGKEDNSFTVISECQDESWCELRNRSYQRPMYCFGYINFWISFRSPLMAVGVRNDHSGRRRLVLTSWTPPSSADFQLDSISHIGFTNEEEELSFVLSRDIDVNACYVREEEETSIQQCGDNFYDRDLCIQCRCCYQEHRQPPCFYSIAEKETQVNRCLRSIEELSRGITFIAQTPSYVGENVSFLILIGTLRPNFTFTVEFGVNESTTIVDDILELRPHVPQWAHGYLPLRFSALLNLNETDDIVTSQEKDYFGVELSRMYNDTGHFAVSFNISGQLTLANAPENFVAQAFVEIQRRPTLAELINFTWLVSRSPAFSDEKTEFIYLLENILPDLSYAVDFGDESEILVFNSSGVETRGYEELRVWLSTNDDSLSSINFTEAKSDRMAQDFLNWPSQHCLVFDHVYLKPGNYVVSVNASGYILAVNRHDQQITTLSIDVQRRPKLTELIDGLVFVASSPVYDREPIWCAIFVENNHPSLYAAVDFGDESDHQLINLSRSISAPEWISDAFLHTAHAMNDSQIQDFLNLTRRFIGNEFNHTYQAIGTYVITIVISGYYPAVLNSDNIRMTAETKVKSRSTLSQAIGRLILLIKTPVYVNETANFMIGTEYFYPELTYTLNFGDLSSRVLFKQNETESVYDWNRNRNQSSNQKDDFLGTEASPSFRMQTVKHVYKSVGNYKAMLYISGVLEVVRKCDVAFTEQDVCVQRRPSLSEIVRRDVHLVAKSHVYTNQDANVFLIVPRNLSNLSYAVDCDNGLAAAAVTTRRLMNLPDWITNGGYRIASIPQSLQLDDFLISTGSFFAGSTSCRYKTPNNYNITLNVHGNLDSFGKVDFHQLSLSVAVISRPSLSKEIGRIWMFVRKPVYVSEEINCIVLVENYFSQLQYSLGTDRGTRLSNGDLVFRQNLSLPDWIQKRNFYASSDILTEVNPNNVYWTQINVTFQSSKSVDVTFNVSGKLDTVDRWENVTKSVKVFPVEIPKLSELLKNRCVIINVSIPVVERIIGFIFLCEQILHQEQMNFTISFGDDSSEEMLIVSSEYRLPNWIRKSGEPILQKMLVEAAAKHGNKSTHLHEYNGAAFYCMYHTAGKREIRVIVSAEPGFRVSGSNEFVFRHQVLIENSPVQPKPSGKCWPYSVSIRGGGISFDIPGKFGRNEAVRLEAVLHSDCLVTEEQAFAWEILDGNGNAPLLHFDRSKDPSDKRKLTLDPYSLHYGKYKIIVKVRLRNEPSADLVMRDETWISMEPSALHVELFGGPVVVTDYFREVSLTAVNYEDIDEPPPDKRSNDPIFTWFCTGPNEELPQELLKHASHGSGGCFGEGPQIANGSSDSLLFRPDHSVFRSLPAVFIVHVFISKPGRTPTGSQQAVIVLPKGPPSIRIVCVSNCGEFLNADDRLVLNSTCLDCTSTEKLDFLWELESTCHQNAMKESDWRKELSAQNTANQIVVDPRVFAASAGDDSQYRLRVTVTRQEKSQASAVYTVHTRSQAQAQANDPPSKLSQDVAAEAAVGAVETSRGHRTIRSPYLSIFLFLLLLLLSVLRFSRL